MIATLLMACILMLGLLILIIPLPKVHYPHAAKIKIDQYKPPKIQWYLLLCLFKDKTGKAINIFDCFIGQVDGNSMEKHGLRNQSLFFAHYYDSDDKTGISRDDLVVVKSETHGDDKFRLRKVSEIIDDEVVFYDHDKRRKLSEVHAILFHVIE